MKTIAVWDNWARPNGATNTIRPLTRSSGTSREGLAMQATRTCSEDCDNAHIARGLCLFHYNRARRRGGMVNLPKRTVAERLAAHLVRQPNGCLEWTDAGTSNGGYGAIKDIDGRLVGAHRLAWSLANGPIPEGFHILHHCDNPPCCETDPSDAYPEGHLFLGTRSDNMTDMVAKGRGRHDKTALRGTRWPRHAMPNQLRKAATTPTPSPTKAWSA